MAPPDNEWLTSSPLAPDHAPADEEPVPVPAPATAATGSLEGKLLRKLLEALGDPPVRIGLWNGEEICTCAGAPQFRVDIHDRATLMKICLNPDLQFGDAYSQGRLTIEGDLVALLEAVIRAAPRHDARKRVKDTFSRWLNRPRSNTLGGSRQNIHHHYDIGNAFYKLWLDERMLYTCAYFPSSDASLEEAQLAKMHHVSRKLMLKPGQTVAEAGFGWGSLALHMAQHYGVTVRAYNISQEQVAYARNRARELGLSRQVEFIEDDYRNMAGQVDAFVSVGMLEHVGHENYQALGEVIDRCLKPGGFGLIHSIGRNKAESLHPWIEKRIFPGAYPPSLKEMMDIFEPWQLSVLDVENLRLHYAQTLQHWLARFEAARDEVEAMYDADFVRTWRLYLAGSIASFLTGGLQLFQVVFARAHNNTIPMTRAHIYWPAEG